MVRPTRVEEMSMECICEFLHRLGLLIRRDTEAVVGLGWYRFHTIQTLARQHLSRRETKSIHDTWDKTDHAGNESPFASRGAE